MYVLIIMLAAIKTEGGGAVTTAEFTTKTTCEVAARAAEANNPFGTRVKAFCVPK